MEPVGLTATRIPAGERTGLRALAFARWAWMGVALLLVGNFVASIPVYYRTLRTVCTLSVNPCRNWQPTPDNMLALTRLHIPVDVYPAYFLSLDVAASLLFWTVGMLIFWRKSREWMGLFFSLVLIIFGSCGISDTLLGDYLSYDAPFLLGLPLLLLNLIQWPLLGTFLATFPTGRFAPRWSWVIVVLWLGQLAYFWLTNVVPVLSNFLLLVVLATYGSTFGLQVYRYVRVYDRVQRQQVKWCLYAFCTGLAVVILGNGVLGGLVAPLNAPDSWFQLLNGTFVVLLFAPIPLAIGVAIFRYHLYDIDILINRTLVYGTLSASVIGLYVLIVGYFAALFRIPNNPAFSLIATALVAMVFQPLRGLLQRVVNRLMYGERDAPYQVLARLDQQIAQAMPPEEVLPELVKTIATTLKLPYVAVTLVQSDVPTLSEERLVAICGQPPPHALVERLPLVYQGEAVGQFVLAPRSGEAQLTRTDRQLLEDLARHAGVIAHAVRHAQARSCTLTVQRGRNLILTISDDGCGLPAAPVLGIGVRSMRQRAEELGGSCTIEARREGGTLVVARLPLMEDGNEPSR